MSINGISSNTCTIAAPTYTSYTTCGIDFDICDVDALRRKLKAETERAESLEIEITKIKVKYTQKKPIPTVKRILKNGDYMTVLWEDGDKTIVKRADDEAESDYAAFTAALGIKCYGSNSALKRLVASAEVQGKKKKKQKEESQLKPIANKLSKICEVMAEANRGEKK